MKRFEAWLRYRRRCHHRSHVLRLPCFRAFVWDGYCFKHNDSCWMECK